MGALKHSLGLSWGSQAPEGKSMNPVVPGGSEASEKARTVAKRKQPQTGKWLMSGEKKDQIPSGRPEGEQASWGIGCVGIGRLLGGETFREESALNKWRRKAKAVPGKGRSLSTGREARKRVCRGTSVQEMQREMRQRI